MRTRKRKDGPAEPESTAAWVDAYEAIDEEKQRRPKAKCRPILTETWRLVQMTHEQAIEATVQDVARAIVKVTAELRPSEREAFDGAGIRKRLVELGARTVILAPKVVPETPKEPDKVARAENPQASVERWFDSLPATVDAQDRARALELSLRLVARAEGER